MLKQEVQYKEKIAQILGTSSDRIFLYWKGRVALHALLRAMQIGSGDEVIVPAFTCIVVPNAIKYLGAKPIYVDINPTTYNADYQEVAKKITPKTKAIICQNTFGLSSDIEALVALAQQHKLFTIEDCTHGFGGTYNGRPNGSYCDAAFYSTQWNKPFSTGIGGFAVVNNEKLLSKLDAVNEDLERATRKDNWQLRILYFVRERILTARRYWKMLAMYRFLSRYNLVQGSSSGGELCSIEPPKHYFKAISQAQIAKGLQNIDKIGELSALRKRNAQTYNDYLQQRGKTFVSPQLFDNHAFLKFPLLVQRREEVLRLTEKRHIPLGEWFCSPLHPTTENLTLWDFDEAQFPIASDISKKMVNLPTDVPEIAPVLAFLNEILDDIL